MRASVVGSAHDGLNMIVGAYFILEHTFLSKIWWLRQHPICKRNPTEDPVFYQRLSRFHQLGTHMKLAFLLKLLSDFNVSLRLFWPRVRRLLKPGCKGTPGLDLHNMDWRLFREYRRVSHSMFHSEFCGAEGDDLQFAYEVYRRIVPACP